MPVADAEAAEERLRHERRHARHILETGEANWGWRTAAGVVRWQRRLQWLAAVTELLPAGASPILEVGAGTGTFTAGLADAMPGLIAIDVSEELLAVARARGVSARLLCMDAHRLAFADGGLAAIVGCSVLHHLEWESALACFHQRLRPGGVVRFSEPNLANPQILLQKSIPWLKRRMGDSPDEWAFTAGRIRRALSRIGFVEVAVRAYEFLHPATPRPLISVMLRVEALLSRTPLVGIAGSLHITARKAG